MVLLLVGATDGQLRNNMTNGGPEWNKVMDEVLMVLSPRWKRPKETYPTYAPTVPTGNDTAAAPAEPASAAPLNDTIITASLPAQRALGGMPPGASASTAAGHRHTTFPRPKPLSPASTHKVLPHASSSSSLSSSQSPLPPLPQAPSSPLQTLQEQLEHSWKWRQRLLSQVIDETLSLYGDNKVWPAPYASTNTSRSHALLASNVSAYLPSLCAGLPEGLFSANANVNAATPTSSAPAQGAPAAASIFSFGKTAGVAAPATGSSDHNYRDTFRMGCCHTVNEEYDERYLFNVKLEGKTLVLFSKNDPSPLVDAVAKTLPMPLPRGLFRGGRDETTLPPVQTDFFQQRHFFSMTAQRREGFMRDGRCRAHFRGTLHITGSSTLNNLYHAMVDNFLTLAAQVRWRLWPAWKALDRLASRPAWKEHPAARHVTPFHHTPTHPLIPTLTPLPPLSVAHPHPSPTSLRHPA